MSDVSKHIRLGNGITAEFMEGVVILFRRHKDPNHIPGDVEQTFIARESEDGFQLVDTSGADATFLVHQERLGDEHEFKAYCGDMGKLSQRRLIDRFLAQISLQAGVIERHKNGRRSHVKRVGKKDLSIETEGGTKCQR